MGTSSTSASRRLYAVLLAGSTALAFVLRAVLDALALRTLRRRTDRRASETSAPGPTARPTTAPGDGAARRSDRTLVRP